MSVPVNISIDRLKRISILWNNYKYHTSQISNGIISGIVCIAFPFIAMSILKDKTDPIIMVLALLGIVFISVGIYNLVRANNYKMELNLWDQKEVEDFNNLVDYLSSLKPDDSIFFFHNIQQSSNQSRKTYMWVAAIDEETLFLLRKPKREIHFCAKKTFTIKQKGKPRSIGRINAHFHINDKTVHGYISQKEYVKYTMWKNSSSVAAVQKVQKSEETPEEEIYKVDF